MLLCTATKKCLSASYWWKQNGVGVTVVVLVIDVTGVVVELVDCGIEMFDVGRV